MHISGLFLCIFQVYFYAYFRFISGIFQVYFYAYFRFISGLFQVCFYAYFRFISMHISGLSLSTNHNIRSYNHVYTSADGLSFKSPVRSYKLLYHSVTPLVHPQAEIQDMKWQPRTESRIEMDTHGKTQIIYAHALKYGRVFYWGV